MANTQRFGADGGDQGLTRVMLILLALGPEHAAKTLQHLTPSEIEAVSTAAEDLRGIDAQTLATTANAFAATFDDAPGFIGTADEVRALLEPERRAEAKQLEGMPIAKKEVWEILAELETDRLQRYLSAQHPQAIAFIVSKLDPAKATASLQAMSTAQRNDIVARMASLGNIHESVEKSVRDAVERDLAEFEGGSRSATAMADIINRLAQQQSKEVVEYLVEHDPDLAKAIKRMLFQFEDIASLPARTLAVLVERLPVDRLVVALHGTDAQFHTTLLDQMAPRARRMVEAELRSGAGTDPAKIQEARRWIAGQIVAMARDGSIQLARADEPSGGPTS